MSKSKKAVNAGVHGASGVEFQKHCALYILFDQYNAFKDKNYFICLEHYEDFLFCFRDSNDVVISIDAYQAKKAASPWGMEGELFELIHKIISVGVDLYEDDIPKIDVYTHRLNFVTNNSITLNNGKKKGDVKIALINEANNNVLFNSLDSTIRDKIINELKARQNSLQMHINELQRFSLMHIDLPKTTMSQKDNLVGLFDRIFGRTIIDHRAAVDTLLLLFRDAENYINQGNVAKLLDERKRVNSSTINETLKVINSKQKAFDLWRSKGEAFAEALKISVWEQENFKLQFDNCFDFFKDLRQVEHRKILSYVRDNRQKWVEYFNDVSCVNEIYDSFTSCNRSVLSVLDVKAAIFAAYIEIKG